MCFFFLFCFVDDYPIIFSSTWSRKKTAPLVQITAFNLFEVCFSKVEWPVVKQNLLYAISVIFLMYEKKKPQKNPAQHTIVV